VSLTLPSIASANRERRLRAIRRLLHDHIALIGENDRVTGCECGWRVPRTVFGGTVAQRDHVAALLAELG
jgi:hypothetical protein